MVKSVARTALATLLVFLPLPGVKAQGMPGSKRIDIKNPPGLASPSEPLEEVRVALENGRDAKAISLATAFITESEHGRASRKQRSNESYDLAMAYYAVGECYRRQRRPEKAEPAARLALMNMERAVDPDAPDLLETMTLLADALADLGRYIEAEQLARREMKLAERGRGPDSPEFGSALGTLAYILVRQDRLREAESPARKALTILDTGDAPGGIGSPRPSKLAEFLDLTAWISYKQGRYAEAEPLARRALSILERLHGAEDARIIGVMRDLGYILIRQNRFAECDLLARRSLAIGEKFRGLESPDVVYSLNLLASSLESQGRPQEAEPLLRRGLEIREKDNSSCANDLALTINVLATFLTNHGRIDEAEPLARRALKLADKESESGKVSISEICRTLVLLSGIHSVQRRGAEADRLARRSLAMAERAWGESDSKVVEPLLAVAVAVSGLGHLDEAEVLLKRSLRICEKDPGCIEKLQDVYVMLELVLRVQGKIAESQEMKAKMVSIASMRH